MFIPFEEGEVMLAKVHRHWLFIAGRVLLLAAFLAVPPALVPLLERLGLVAFAAVSGGALVALWALWALVGWAIFWQFWTTYWMDIWVVTNRRIIDIDYQRLFDRNIAMLRLDRVQDVTTHVTGVIGTVLRYGSVVVQTAGSDKQFVIDQIADPERLRDVISQAAGAAAEHMRTVVLER